MASVTITRGESLNGFFQRTLEYIHQRYHNYSLQVEHYDLSTEEEAEMNFYQGMGIYDSQEYQSNIRYDATGDNVHVVRSRTNLPVQLKTKDSNVRRCRRRLFYF